MTPQFYSGALRTELLSVEHLEERARSLAASYTLARDPGHRVHSVLPRFNENARLLRSAYRTLVQAVRQGEAVAPAERP